MQIFLREIYSLTTLTHAHFALDLAFTNTMSQNHSTADGNPGRNQIDNTALNTMG